MQNIDVEDLIRTNATLSSLAQENDDYNILIENYPRKLETAMKFIDKVAFVKNEIARITSFYLMPITITSEAGNIINEINYTKYAKQAYDWLLMGQDWAIAQILSSVKSSSRNNMGTSESEFSQSILFQLKRGVAYLMYEKFLRDQLSQVEDSQTKIAQPIVNNISSLQNVSLVKENEDVFISYSWDSNVHENRVMSFTNFLRKKGFKAEMDKMLAQEESSIDFVKMMHHKMVKSKKVIIVLSTGYKNKAENFKGGVGEEYKLILKDIVDRQTKYILISFEGISKDITPLGFIGREIIDMQRPDAEEQLFAKLMDYKFYEFSEVSEQKPILQTKPIAEFETPRLSPNVEIGNIISKFSNSSSIYNLYRYVENLCGVKIRNTGNQTLHDFTVEIFIPKELIPDYYTQVVKGEYVVQKYGSGQKILPGEDYLSPELRLKLSLYNIDSLIDAVLTVTVFTELGKVKKEFPIKGFFVAKDNYSENMPISRELFLDRSSDF